MLFGFSCYRQVFSFSSSCRTRKGSLHPDRYDVARDLKKSDRSKTIIDDLCSNNSANNKSVSIRSLETLIDFMLSYFETQRKITGANVSIFDKNSSKVCVHKRIPMP